VKDLEDISLVTQAAVFHNKRAFEKLVVKYQSQVRRFFLSQTLGDEPLSDDLAQDTFIKAYLNIDKFRGTSSFSTWLYRIAYNVYYDYVRSHKLTEDMDSAAVSRKNSEQGDSNLKMDLQQAMALLSGNERTCVVLQLMEGQSIDKIADITGIVEGSVKSYLSRGKQKLATYLRQNGYDGK
jgi:RNA polymerase sigma-70 factor (ECF subfamily)